jgi:hypothetical protein
MSTPTITIRAELVSLVRSGAYLTLNTGAAAIVSLVEGCDRETDADRYVAPFALLDGGRILLRAIGWTDPCEPYAVDVDGEHRPALLAALSEQAEAERGLAEDQEASLGERAEAKVRAGQLADFIARVEEE